MDEESNKKEFPMLQISVDKAFKKAGVNGYQVAKHMEKKPNYISQFRRKDCNPHLSTLFELKQGVEKLSGKKLDLSDFVEEVVGEGKRARKSKRKDS